VISVDSILAFRSLPMKAADRLFGTVLRGPPLSHGRSWQRPA
jgi:hypothetical protein